MTLALIWFAAGMAVSEALNAASRWQTRKTRRREVELAHQQWRAFSRALREEFEAVETWRRAGGVNPEERQ